MRFLVDRNVTNVLDSIPYAVVGGIQDKLVSTNFSYEETTRLRAALITVHTILQSANIQVLPKNSVIDSHVTHICVTHITYIPICVMCVRKYDLN